MIEIKVMPNDITIRERAERARLLELLWRNGIAVESLCGGTGVCGRCRVRVLSAEGRVSEITRPELKHLGDLIGRGFRLACMVMLSSGRYVVELPEYRHGVTYAALGYERTVPLRPCVRRDRLYLKLLRDLTRSDLTLRGYDNAINKVTGLDVDSLHVLRELSNVVARGLDEVILIAHRGQVIDVREKSVRPLGVAIDVGTTKIVVHLVDLESGSTLDYDVSENPQIRYGADIISRISNVMRGATSAEDLRKIVINEINNMMSRMCSRCEVSHDQIYLALVAGNTVMTHLALGLNPSSLGFFPYTPVLSRLLVLRPSEIGIRMSETGVVYVLPSLGSFVGGDAVADMIAADVINRRGNVLLIDLGTNTEIVLKSGDSIYVTSAPAGSAIDGVGITCGIRPCAGAIDHVYVSDDLEVEYDVIGDVKPIGIAGTGVLDAVAELVAHKVVDPSGRIRLDVGSPRVRRRGDALEFVIAWREESGHGEDIVITQHDVRLVQYAKAAVESAWRVLLKEAGLRESDIDEVLVAGSFGSNVRRDTLRTLCIVPRVPEDRIAYLGNSVIAGLKALMRDCELIDDVYRIYRTAKVIELPLREDFSRIFVESTKFVVE